MVDGELGVPGIAVRPFPLLDVPSLDPGDGLTRRIARGADGGGLQAPGAQVVGNAGDFAIDAVQGFRELVAQRLGVDQPPNLGRSPHPSRYELRPPAKDVEKERSGVGPKDVRNRQRFPQVGEFIDGLLEGTMVSGEVRHIDRASGYAGEDGDAKLRIVPCQAAQKAHLIGGSRTAPRHHQTELIGALVPVGCVPR